MKLSARLAKLRQRKHASASGKANEVPSSALAASTCVLIALALLLACVGTLSALEFFVWNKIPPELVGVWEFSDGPQKHGTFEFSRNGTMELRTYNKKKPLTTKAAASVRDKTLFITEKATLGREQTTTEAIIRELTADTLILELEKGEVLKMVRVE
jgi:hypothetical protein